VSKVKSSDRFEINDKKDLNSNEVIKIDWRKKLTPKN